LPSLLNIESGGSRGSGTAAFVFCNNTSTRWSVLYKKKILQEKAVEATKQKEEKRKKPAL
jgi:hypothetical protein